MTLLGPQPQWLTFDCYGTLIQWDEGLMAAVRRILAQSKSPVDPKKFLEIYDRYEHRLEQSRPHLSFRDVSAGALRVAMSELSLAYEDSQADILTSSISAMPPFPEVVSTLSQLKDAGFKLAVISNTDDAIISGNIAQLGGHIDRVITAEQAQAYKPSPQIFLHAWGAIGASKDQLVHICASPHLDLAAARDIGFRAIWIDRGTGRRPLPDYVPNATARTLQEVPALLSAAGWM